MTKNRDSVNAPTQYLAILRESNVQMKTKILLNKKQLMHFAETLFAHFSFTVNRKSNRVFINTAENTPDGLTIT